MSAVAAAKRRKARRERRGVALILVLGAITILTVFLTELQGQTSADLAAAVADRDALRAEYYARSGVSLARMLIATEPAINRSIAPLAGILGQKIPQIPVWLFSDMVLGPFNDEASAAAFSGISGLDVKSGKNLGLTGGGHYELTIVDEDSKINLNAAAKGEPTSQLRLAVQMLGLIAGPQYNEMFEERDADGQFTDRATACGALVDWADFDDKLFTCDPFTTTAGSEGAEDNFYQTIGLDYVRKNAAFDSLDEVRLVRGMGDDFWATFVDPEPSNPQKRVMTVWGQGTINVNTANELTLLAIICGNEPTAPLCTDPLQQSSFVMGVSMIKQLTMGAPVFSSPKDFIKTLKGQGMLGPLLASLQVQPVTFTREADVLKTISTQSKIFSIYVDGVVPGFKRETRVRVHAVVDFRAAAPPGGPLAGLPGGTAPPPAPAAGAAAGSQASTNPTPEEIAAALATNPAGNIIYWRLE